MAKATGPFTKPSFQGAMRPPPNTALYADKVVNEASVLNWLTRRRRLKRK